MDEFSTAITTGEFGMDVRKNKALWIVGQVLLVSLALAAMAGGWFVIGAG